MVLWGLYFSLGFRAFARGVQANAMGLLLTLGLAAAGVPRLSRRLAGAGGPAAAGQRLQPDVGAADCHLAARSLFWAPAALGLARFSFARCDRELRNWYDQHHGLKVVD